MCTKLLQSRPTLCNPMDYSSLGPSVHGIFQARGGLLFPSPGNLPDPGIEPVSLISPALADQFFTTSTIWEACLRVSVQFSSVTQSCLTLCDPMDRSTSGLPVHHQLPEFTKGLRVWPTANAYQAQLIQCV